MPHPTTPKFCRWCGVTKPLGDFYTHPRMLDGHLNKCKDCVRAYARAKHRDRIENDAGWRDKERARSRAKYKRYGHVGHPGRSAASDAVANAVKRGDLIPAEACEDCGHDFSEFRREAHHHDYSKPLDVHWLCSLCHGKRHRQAA